MNITRLLPIHEYWRVVTIFMVTNVKVITPEYAQFRPVEEFFFLGGGMKVVWPSRAVESKA